MSKKSTANWERMAYLWQAQGLSLREIQRILVKRGLAMSHELVRQGIERMAKVINRPLDNKKLFVNIKKNEK